MGDVQVQPLECSVYFSFMRLCCELSLGSPQPLAIFLLLDGQEESLDGQRIHIDRPGAGPVRFTLEALVNRDLFPDRYSVRIGFRGSALVVPCRELVDREQSAHAESMLTDFHLFLDEWLRRNPGRRPKMLDIGGRARSGYRHSKVFEQCDVTIADIVGDESVDIVTDVHRMSGDVGSSRFDFAICISVFEHLVMPWKAAIEINKVMKPNGIVMIQTHQTVGLHDLPWDYYRFSDQSWKGLFNAGTGFQIEKTLMSNFQRIVPAHHYAVSPGFENAGGFLESAVIVRKTGETRLAWPVELTDLVDTSYPG